MNMVKKRTKTIPLARKGDALSWQQRLLEGCFILSIAVALFLMLSFLTYRPIHLVSMMPVDIGGRIGAKLARLFLFAFGYLAYVFPCLCIALGCGSLKYVSRGDYSLILTRFCGACVVFISACGLLNSLDASSNPLGYGKGGYLGLVLAHALTAQLSLAGTVLFLGALLFSGVTLITGLSFADMVCRPSRYLMRVLKNCWMFFSTMMLRLKRRINPTKPLTFLTPKTNLVELNEPLIIKPKLTQIVQEPQAHKIQEQKVPKKIKEKPEIVLHQKPEIASHQKSEIVSPQVIGKQSTLPSLDCLDKPEASAQEAYSHMELEQLSREVELRLKDFGIDVQVVGILPGPVITRFEMKLAPGVKVSRISALVKDLARSLSVISVRIVEVIPGKSVVGLEVPNRHREVVRLSEILASKSYQQASVLSFALGKDISGNPVVVELGRMPHLLVAGTTGSGKSVGLNAMLLSILFKATPQQVRLILIDPKMLELAIYEGIPHLLAPVVTDMKEAANALRWCVAEMERRYRLMAHLGVRNLAGYNHKVSQSGNNPLFNPDEPTEPLAELPYIIVLIDEFADMMMVVGKKVEELIARIAQKARAAGIHLVLATQRPSVDVITGLIKANIPTRIGFQVSSKIDSRTILDQQGAEQLLGHGDMLYLAPGTGLPIRVHGAFVADHEVHTVVDRVKAWGPPDYKLAITQDDEDGGEANAEQETDPLYHQAVQIVMQTRRASISGIQRRLKIGYNRAARIVEDMERAGLVSAMDHTGNREVLASE
jgi:DNA segregation ATPase FtsK/SpoIIIE, S-DNA-T family